MPIGIQTPSPHELPGKKDNSVQRKGLDIEAISAISNEITRAKDVIPNVPPKEPISVIESGKPKVLCTADVLAAHLQENGIQNDLALEMAAQLDAYIADKYPQKVDKAVKKALEAAKKSSEQPISQDEMQQIALKAEESVRNRFNMALEYFVTIDPRKGNVTPFERMVEPFSYLQRPSNANDFNRGATAFIGHFAVLAFEQHFENPEQYVSHGFDHSINVANFTRRVLGMNFDIVLAAMNKYHISQGEAKFMLEMVALLHDCGYPCVGCRGKAVHGISGADLILPMKPMIEKLLNLPREGYEALFNDFRNAILFHSADKIEQSFSTKIVSTLGTFLADHNNIVQILSNFYDPSKNPSGQPKYALEIYVQNPQMRDEVEKNLMAARWDLEMKIGKPLDLPAIKIHEGLFKGRFADLETNKDRLLGLEFNMTDLLDSPLTMIRLVDNMDMCETRLTPTQNEAAFHEIYHILGNGGSISTIMVGLEKLERKADELQRQNLSPGDRLKLTNENLLTTRKWLQGHLEKLGSANQEPTLVKNILSKIKWDQCCKLETIKDLRSYLTTEIVNGILEDERFRDLPEEKKDAIRRIGLMQSSFDLRHFGGCESVIDVQLAEPASGETRMPVVVVTVDKEKFEELNKVKVTESSPGPNGAEQSVTVGVGEYQVWRASDAYRSILLRGSTVSLIIQDTQGAKVNPSFQTV